jgi:hypothetical protein
MAQIRRINVSARSKERMSVNISALIRVEGGILMKEEVAKLRTALADRLMVAVTDIPYLNAHISEVKVTR